MEGDTIIMQEIFAFRQIGVDDDGRAHGEFIATGIRPTFMDRLEIVRLPPLARPLPAAGPLEGLSSAADRRPDPGSNGVHRGRRPETMNDATMLSMLIGIGVHRAGRRARAW